MARRRKQSPSDRTVLLHGPVSLGAAGSLALRKFEPLSPQEPSGRQPRAHLQPRSHSLEVGHGSPSPVEPLEGFLQAGGDELLVPDREWCHVAYRQHQLRFCGAGFMTDAVDDSVEQPHISFLRSLMANHPDLPQSTPGRGAPAGVDRPENERRWRLPPGHSWSTDPPPPGFLPPGRCLRASRFDRNPRPPAT
jgi:hypothetical protein